MKQWTADNPKAELMQRKRGLIVEAARDAFLEKGYAESSMSRIAETAGVSIKTVYRHFDNKDDLFSAVMHAACGRDGLASLDDKDTAKPSAVADRPWASKAPSTGLILAGIDYLNDLLGEEQLALYRMVARDAHRFPELGERFQAEVTSHRNALFASYLQHWAPVEGWKIKHHSRAASTFMALLRTDLFDNALLGSRYPEKREIAAHARSASTQMLLLLQANCF